MINVKIITPKGLYRSCEAKQINARSVEGEFGLLEHHMPMVAMLAISRLELVSENERHRFAIAGGMLYFQNDEARILTDSIESEDESSSFFACSIRMFVRYVRKFTPISFLNN